MIALKVDTQMWWNKMMALTKVLERLKRGNLSHQTDQLKYVTF